MAGRDIALLNRLGRKLGFDNHPSTVYVRTATDQVEAVHDVLAATANPEAPSEVDVSNPSDALVARAKAKSAFNGLFLGLGAVSLLVGAVGVANIMVISVLERRSEIGLRRALGATRANIRAQFLSEAMLLSLLGGCNRPVAKAESATAAVPSARVDTPRIDHTVSQDPVGKNNVPAAATAPPGQRVDNAVNAGPNPSAPAPASGSGGSGGAVSTSGRGGSGSSLSPTVSGTSPYANTTNNR